MAPALAARIETIAPYLVTPARDEDSVIAAALAILERKLNDGDFLASPNEVRAYLRLRVGGEPREHFGVVFLDAQNRCLGAEEMFAGTLTQTSVYPREIVKASLLCNASSVILYHNHPSGLAEPSAADESLTRAVRRALDLVDVRVLDHFVVTAGECFSFAEKGLI